MLNYDLGMIRVFLHVYETRSVTTTAERLYISQPSVSYTLRKLRNHFSDPLFIRRGQRLEPTPAADAAYPRLRRLIDSLDETMETALHFDPATSTRRFRLTLTDVGVSGLLPRILNRFRAEAPNMRLEVEILNLSTVEHNLRTGATDAAICTNRLDETDLERSLLFRQEYRGLRAANHPRIGSTPTLEEYEREAHVTVSTSTGHTALDQRARELGIHRDIIAVVPTFSSLPHLITGTDLLSYAPSSTVTRLTAAGQLQPFDIPFEVPITEVALYVARRELPSAESDWLQNTLVDVLAE